MVKMILNYCRYQKVNGYKLFPRAKLSDVYNDIKSGDIMLFSALAHNIITSAAISSTHSHVGIVVELNGNKYILEIFGNDYISPNFDILRGVHLTPLYERIMYYPGNVYIMPLKNKLTCEQESKLQEFSKVQFDYEYNFINSLLRVFIHHNFFTNKICLEHVAMALKYSGITNIIDDQLSLEMANAITSLPYLHLESGNSYKPIVQILFDDNTFSCL
jgi:hypothetical protein